MLWTEVLALANSSRVARPALRNPPLMSWTAPSTRSPICFDVLGSWAHPAKVQATVRIATAGTIHRLCFDFMSFSLAEAGWRFRAPRDFDPWIHVSEDANGRPPR